MLTRSLGAELVQTPSFKIAGIDVLTTGEEASPTRNEEELRRFNEVVTAVGNLYVLYNVPMPPSTGYYPQGPRPRRSFSNRDDSLDAPEMITSTSPSPIGREARAKRARKYSQSSSMGEAPYYRSSLTYGDTASSESLTQRMQGMSANTPGPGIETQEARLPTKRQPHAVANPPKFMPIYTPMHHPHHTQHGYPLGSHKVSFASHEAAGADGSSGRARQHRVEDFISDDENRGERASHRRLSRLSIPSDGADGHNTANQTPKLTKTGRVSKALRGEPVHACNICDKVYTRAEHLRRHRANHRVNLMSSETEQPH